MSASFSFNNSVGKLITNGPLLSTIMDGAREVGLQIGTRAPGVEFGLNAGAPTIGQP